MWSRQTRQLVQAACEEDLATVGDITSALLPDVAADVTGRIVPREEGIICGLALGPLVCDVFSRRLGQPLTFAPAVCGERDLQDGDALERGVCVATVRGRHAAVLALERTLLNFLGRMSGVATLTSRYLAAAREGSSDVKILDTRKTIPGWRELDKYAVRGGGGRNHRVGLYDAILIKDNHLAGIPADQLAGELTKLLSREWPTAPAQEDANTLDETESPPAPTFVEVEVDDLDQFAAVCEVPGVDIVLLDNFTLKDLRAAVKHRDAQALRGRLALEASGGITLDNVGKIAATGVDRISIGGLTHSAPSLDLGLDLGPGE